jgi:hypothetical protein
MALYTQDWDKTAKTPRKGNASLFKRLGQNRQNPKEGFNRGYDHKTRDFRWAGCFPGSGSHEGLEIDVRHIRAHHRCAKVGRGD